MNILNANEKNSQFVINNPGSREQYQESYVFMDETEYEYFEERAAILEFDGKLERVEAEQVAYKKIVQNRKRYSRAS